ncbi:MAG TPA: hypothetical protein VF352_08850 [Anaerolineales bacterium]
MLDRFFNQHIVWILNRLKRLGGAIPRRLVKGIFLALLLGSFAASDLVPTYAAPEGQNQFPQDTWNKIDGYIFYNSSGKEIEVTALEKNSSSPLTICKGTTTELLAKIPISFYPSSSKVKDLVTYVVSQTIVAAASPADIVGITTRIAKITRGSDITLESFSASFMVKGLKKGEADITFTTTIANQVKVGGMLPPTEIKIATPRDASGTFHVKVEDCKIKVNMTDHAESAYLMGVGYMNELTLQPGAVEGTYSASAPYTFNTSLYLPAPCSASLAPAVSQTTFTAQVTDQGINLHWDFGPVNEALAAQCGGASRSATVQSAVDKSHVVTEATFGPDGGTVVKPSSASPTDYYTIIVTREDSGVAVSSAPNEPEALAWRLSP